MASSTAEELSQESDELKASYFTHHLVTALRGAGDGDGDGRVSLDEAYRYAYRRTLASTARTQVGEQHVTLETDLAGQGEVPVTFPAEARAQLDLPAPARGARARAAAPERRRDGRRAEGARRARAPRARRRQLRRGGRAEERDRRVPRRPCPTGASRSSTPAPARRCAPTRPSRRAPSGTTTRRGRSPGASATRRRTSDEARGRRKREVDRWTIEAAVGLIQQRTDAYTSRLNEFGYQARRHRLSRRSAVAAGRLAAAHRAPRGASSRSRRSRATATSGRSRGDGHRLVSRVRSARPTSGPSRTSESWLGVYGQAGGGFGVGVVDLETQQTGVAPSAKTYSIGLRPGRGGRGDGEVRTRRSPSSSRAGTTTRR